MRRIALLSVVAGPFLLEACAASDDATGSKRGEVDSGSPDAAGGGTDTSSGGAAGTENANGGNGTTPSGGAGTTSGGSPGSGGSLTGVSGESGVGGLDGGTVEGGSAADAGDDVCRTATVDGECNEENAVCGGPCPSACSFCNLLRCTAGAWSAVEVFPAPCFDCGTDARCQRHAEYCAVHYSDVVGLPDEYSCSAMPSACTSDVTCECLGDEIFLDQCTEDESGELLVEHFGG